MKDNPERDGPPLKATPLILWTADAGGEARGTHEWHALTGQTEEEARGQGWLEALHPADRSGAADLWREAIRTGNPYEAEFRIRKRDGGYGYFSVRGVPVGSGNVGVREWVVVCTDITRYRLSTETHQYAYEELELRIEDRMAQLKKVNRDLEEEVAERKRIQQELDEARRKERALFENALDVICAIDVKGEFTQVSPASQKVWGYSPEELVGRKYIELVDPDDVEKTNRAALDIMSGRVATDFENRYRHKDGSVVHIMWTAYWSKSEQLMFCTRYGHQ
jgi:PAS domain S-box-containing protein